MNKKYLKICRQCNGLYSGKFASIFCSLKCSSQSQRKLPPSFRCAQCKNETPTKHRKLRKFCSLKCRNKSYLGKRFSPNTELKKGIVPWHKGKRNWASTGKLNNNWRGGITPLHEKIRRLPEAKNWRREVFKRDNYICKICKVRGGILNADHIKPFSVISTEHSFSSVEDALNCKELWDIENGRTLCYSCHRQTSSWGTRPWIYKEKIYEGK